MRNPNWIIGWLHGDIGRGFNPEDRQKSGFGLRSIRYRAETIGGNLHFTTSPGEGTFTRIKVSPSGPAS